MTVAGLPGIPGGKVLVPALDFFTKRAFVHAREGNTTEMAGIFIWEPDAVDVRQHVSQPDEVEWQGHISFAQCMNVSDAPSDSFELDTQEVEIQIRERLNRMHAIAEIVGGHAGTRPENLLLHGYSPFVGIGHSHPGGTVHPSVADHLMSANATAWRRATAPQTMLGFEEDAKFFEADFLIALQDVRAGKGTLVHFKRGRTEGTWEGNFVSAVD